VVIVHQLDSGNYIAGVPVNAVDGIAQAAAPGAVRIDYCSSWRPRLIRVAAVYQLWKFTDHGEYCLSALNKGHVHGGFGTTVGARWLCFVCNRGVHVSSIF
jgi:hypothetical protein